MPRAGASVHVYGRTYINATNGSTCTAMNLQLAARFTKAASRRSLPAGRALTRCAGSRCPTTIHTRPAIADPSHGSLRRSSAGLPTRQQLAVAAARCTAWRVREPAVDQPIGSCTLASGVYILHRASPISGSLTSWPAAASCSTSPVVRSIRASRERPRSVGQVGHGTVRGPAVVARQVGRESDVVRRQRCSALSRSSGTVYAAAAPRSTTNLVRRRHAECHWDRRTDPRGAVVTGITDEHRRIPSRSRASPVPLHCHRGRSTGRIRARLSRRVAATRPMLVGRRLKRQ